MKTCASCQTANPPTNRFCQQCGRPFGTPEGEGQNATVRWTGQQVSAQGMALPEVKVDTLFGGKSRLVLGRAPDCDVCLPHPMVSRYHALVERRAEGLVIRDLTSVNGIWLNGRRIREAAFLHDGERVGIGPFLFMVSAGMVRALDSSRSLRLEARSLEKVVPVGRGQTRTLLHHVSLVVNPGEFVSLLGPSGSGKSTLMDCLNGRRRASAGQVLANGEDFYRHFDSFRQSLGYVPQRDIVHTQLSVYRALYYTARLRLPTDTDPAELRARLEEVLQQMELEAHRDTLVGNLSGGQIKRVSLGAELLGQPCLLFIDEATSGLDAGTEARMMRLFRRLSDEGRSIICITHNLENVDQCDLVLILNRGRLVFYGPPGEAPAYFGVERVSDIYDRLKEKEAEVWERQLIESPFYEELIVRRLTTEQPEPSGRGETPKQGGPGEEVSAPAEEEEAVDRFTLASLLSDGRRLVSLSQLPPLADRFRDLTSRALRVREYLGPVLERAHQLRVLTARYLELILSDTRGLRLLLLQAPIVAVFLLLGFFDKEYEARLPVPRPLHADERAMLEAFRLTRNIDLSEGEMTPQQREALEKVRVEIPVGEEKIGLTGLQIATLLGRLGEVPEDSPLRRAVRQTRLTVEVAGRPVTITQETLVHAFREMHETHLADKLLDFPGPVVPDSEMVNPRYTYMLLFIVVMVVLWFGCNNAAKEIVKEEAIYSRERAVNLHIFPYLGSKFLVLSLITALHALLLMAVLYGTLHLLKMLFPGKYSAPPALYMLDYPAQLGVLALLGMTGVALGLLLSACVKTPDRANALLPYVLIPQMILGGGLITVKDGSLFYLAATLSPVYWGYRAVHLGAHGIPEHFPGHVPYVDSAWLPCKALLLQTAVLLMVTALFLRVKDSPER